MHARFFIVVLMVFACGAAVLADDGVSTDVSTQADGQERVVDLSNVPVVSGRGREMREVLELIIDTEYCGDATMEGVTQAAALRGNAPVEGIGFVRPTEEDAVAVLCEMATEEFERLSASGAIHTVADIGRLWKMIALLGTAKTGQSDVLAVLWQMARQTTGEWERNVFSAISRVWIDLTIGHGSSKCLELGRYFQESRGVDSKEFWRYIDALGRCDAFGRCPTARDSIELSRFLIQASEVCERKETAGHIDHCAAGDFYFHPADDDPWTNGRPKQGLPGWKGSIQRKHLAERFTGSDAVIADSLKVRAAAELAADESELTDLREVYGDWTQKEEEK